MIKDKDGHPVEILTITTSLRDEMISTIQNRIIHNLEAIKELLKVQGHEDVGGALYTYALEEYGKILFLQDNQHILPNDNNKIKYKYRPKYNKTDRKSHGFLAHDDKFSRMVQDEKLQNSSKVLSKGDYEPNDVVLTDFVVGLIADMEARMSLFYGDFKDQNSIMEPPPVDRGVLDKNVNDFLHFMKTNVFIMTQPT
jgi:hypothetical protein